MTHSQKEEALKVAEQKGFSPIRSGLGLAPGLYSFITADGEDIFGIKEVTSSSTGLKYAITIVAGVVQGAGIDNKDISKQFGTGVNDAQLALTAEQWLVVKPNTRYTIEINAKGRVSSVKDFEVENIIASTAVVTKKKKVAA